MAVTGIMAVTAGIIIGITGDMADTATGARALGATRITWVTPITMGIILTSRIIKTRISSTEIGSDLFGPKTEGPEIASPALRVPLWMSS